ncbi:MAG TPA: hypothetical protein VEZ90_17670 [Blastocatellia bacterium]|nr:hypothetical protein [Blastocatellia bacterium]
MTIFDHHTVPDCPVSRSERARESSGSSDETPRVVLRGNSPTSSAPVDVATEKRMPADARQHAPTRAPFEAHRPVSDLQKVRRALGAFYHEVTLNTREVVLGWRGRAEIDVRVYTSVSKNTHMFHDTGTDCIRVVVFDLRAHRKIEQWSCNLNRTGHLLERLGEKAGAALLHASFRPRCPECQEDSLVISALVEDDPQHWACDTPHCSGVVDIAD